MVGTIWENVASAPEEPKGWEASGGYADIDSGATHSVVGEDWEGRHYRNENIPPLKSSDRTFRFGDSRLFRSKGEIRAQSCLSVTGKKTKEKQLRTCVFGADVDQTYVNTFFGVEKSTGFRSLRRLFSRKPTGSTGISHH